MNSKFLTKLINKGTRRQMKRALDLAKILRDTTAVVIISRELRIRREVGR